VGWIHAGTRHQAYFAISARALIAVARGCAETIEVSLDLLSFSVKRDKRLPQAANAKPVRISVDFRFPLTPCRVASDALVFHGTSSSQRRGYGLPVRELPPGLPCESHIEDLQKECPEFPWLPDKEESHDKRLQVVLIDTIFALWLRFLHPWCRDHDNAVTGVSGCCHGLSATPMRRGLGRSSGRRWNASW
jgi:hypothetical protein